MKKNIKIFLALLITVGIIGTVFFLKTQKNNTPASTQTADPTVNWKTYTNIEGKFSLRYPNTWFTSESSSVIFITEKKIEIPLTHGLASSTGVQINITKEPYEIPKYPWKNSLSPFQIGGLIATRMTDEEPDYSTELMYSRIFFEKNGDTYSIIFSNTDNKGGHNPTYDQILSTFKFLNASENMMMVKLYYHDPKLDPNLEFCEAKDYIEKEIPKTASQIKDTINTLIHSDVFEKNDTFILKSINLKQDGTLILEFPFIGGFTTGGSCRIGIIKSQIEKTALQFPEVKKVVFEPEVFQP